MATKRQIEANRKNAKCSTGPRTKAGRATSSRNAVRHGLASSEVSKNAPTLTLAIQRLLSGLLEPDDAAQMARSRDDLQRIRSARHAMLVAFIEAPYQPRAKQIANLERYERTAFAKRKRLLRSLHIIGPKLPIACRKKRVQLGASFISGKVATKLLLAQGGLFVLAVLNHGIPHVRL